MDQSTSGLLNAPFLIVGLALAVIVIASLWKIFTKASQPGWASIVPFYNLVVLLKVASKPVWWFILLLIPIVSFVIMCIVYISLAKSFGKGAGFGVGLMLVPFVFLPVLAFGDAQYQGLLLPAAAMRA